MNLEIISNRKIKIIFIQLIYLTAVNLFFHLEYRAIAQIKKTDLIKPKSPNRPPETEPVDKRKIGYRITAPGKKIGKAGKKTKQGKIFTLQLRQLFLTLGN